MTEGTVYVASFPGSPSFRAISIRMTFDRGQRSYTYLLRGRRENEATVYVCSLGTRLQYMCVFTQHPRAVLSCFAAWGAVLLFHRFEVLYGHLSGCESAILQTRVSTYEVLT